MEAQLHNTLVCGPGTVKRGTVCDSINSANSQGLGSNNNVSTGTVNSNFFQSGLSSDVNGLRQICGGTVPDNSILCDPSTLGQGEMITNFLGTSCNSGSKCEYRCNDGFSISNGKCVYVGGRSVHFSWNKKVGYDYSPKVKLKGQSQWIKNCVSIGKRDKLEFFGRCLPAKIGANLNNIAAVGFDAKLSGSSSSFEIYSLPVDFSTQDSMDSSLAVGFVASHPVCEQVNTFQNATRCENDDELLASFGIESKLVEGCTNQKCEFICNPGYILNSSSGECEVVASIVEEIGNPDSDEGLPSLGDANGSFFSQEDEPSNNNNNENGVSAYIMANPMNIMFSKNKPNIEASTYLFRSVLEINAGDIVYGRLRFSTKKVKVCIEKITPEEATQGEDFTRVDGTCSQEKAGAYNSSVTGLNEGGFRILDPSISIAQDANSGVGGKWILTQNISSGLDEWVLLKGNKIDEPGHYQATFVTYGNDDSKYVKYAKKRLFVQVNESEEVTLTTNAYAVPMTIEFSKDKPYYQNHSYFFRDYVTAKVGERLYGRISNGNLKMKACIDFISAENLANGKTFPTVANKCNRDSAGNYDVTGVGGFRVLNPALTVTQDAANPNSDWVYIEDKKEWLVVRGLVANDAGEYRVTYASYKENNTILNFSEVIIPINPVDGALASSSSSNWEEESGLDEGERDEEQAEVLPTVEFRRFYSVALLDHVSVATNEYDSFLESNNYKLEGSGRLYSPSLSAAQKVGKTALYLCRQGASNYMISADPLCEGQVVIVATPFAYLSSTNNGGKALYRCRMKSTAVDHFVSVDPACEKQHYEGLLGYGPNE